MIGILFSSCEAEVLECIVEAHDLPALRSLAQFLGTSPSATGAFHLFEPKLLEGWDQYFVPVVADVETHDRQLPLPVEELHQGLHVGLVEALRLLLLQLLLGEAMDLQSLLRAPVFGLEVLVVLRALLAILIEDCGDL